MAIPDYQSLMLPLLELAGDGKEHSLREVTDLLASRFSLTEEERRELLPSGKQQLFNNRVAWAKTYLSQARLLESVGPGRFRITERGRELLRRRPQRIDVTLLNEFPEFVQFRTRRSPRPRPPDDREQATPLENLEEAYEQIREELAAALLETIRRSSPALLERLVVDLLVKMGYGGTLADAGRALGRAGDEGIDGIIKEDPLGLENIYIQAKRWDGVVGRPEIQRFAGALQGQRARKGLFITTSSFSKEALDYAARIDTRIILIDGRKLADLMIEYNVGVTPVRSLEIKKIDQDYFSEE
jgi:restriction system protein